MRAPSRDYSALTDSVRRAELRAFRHSLASTPFRRVPGRKVVNSIAALIGVPIVALIFEALLGFFLLAVTPPGPAGDALAPFIAAVFALGFIVGVVIVYRILRKDVVLARPLRRWYRLDRFSRENQWAYAPVAVAPAYAGCIFTLGREREASDVLRMGEGGAVEIGNYQFSGSSSGTSSGKKQWGYVRIRLGRPLPHMVLEARPKRWSRRHGLPATFKGSQTLSLEGDFDHYFTLYAPHQYQRDALYVFTPDLMALLIDEANRFDVEIVDNYLYVYSPTVFNMLSPATYEGLERIVSTVGAKTWQQTARYADDRAGQFAGRMVAPQGRRLRRTVSVAGVVVFGLWLALHFANPILQAVTGH